MASKIFMNKYRTIFLRPWDLPKKLIRRLTNQVPLGLWFVNFFFQKVLRINGEYAWPIHFTSRVVGRVEIGEGVQRSFAVSGGCYIQGGNGVKIGDRTIFAPGVKIISANHNLVDHKGWVCSPPIKIGKDCWLGVNVVILPGVELGDNVLVAAGAVVTKNFPSGAIVAGVPARIVRFKDGFAA